MLDDIIEELSLESIGPDFLWACPILTPPEKASLLVTLPDKNRNPYISLRNCFHEAFSKIEKKHCSRVSEIYMSLETFSFLEGWWPEIIDPYSSLAKTGHIGCLWGATIFPREGLSRLDVLLTVRYY